MGDDALAGNLVFAPNQEATLEERTQLEVENTAAISITWFIERMLKIQ